MLELGAAACGGLGGLAVAGQAPRGLPRWALAAVPAAIWAALAWRYGLHAPLALAAGLSLLLWRIACIDVATFRIPNALVAAIAILALLARLIPGAAPAGWLPSLLAGAAAGLGFALLVLASRGGFGWGDAKLAAALGWALGPSVGAAALLGTALAGGLGAALALLLRRLGPRDALPFAPFFLVGSVVALLLRARP